MIQPVQDLEGGARRRSIQIGVSKRGLFRDQDGQFQEFSGQGDTLAIDEQEQALVIPDERGTRTVSAVDNFARAEFFVKFPE